MEYASPLSKHFFLSDLYQAALNQVLASDDSPLQAGAPQIDHNLIYNNHQYDPWLQHHVFKYGIMVEHFYLTCNVYSVN